MIFAAHDLGLLLPLLGLVGSCDPSYPNTLNRDMRGQLLWAGPESQHEIISWPANQEYAEA